MLHVVSTRKITMSSSAPTETTLYTVLGVLCGFSDSQSSSVSEVLTALAPLVFIQAIDKLSFCPQNVPVSLETFEYQKSSAHKNKTKNRHEPNASACGQVWS